MWEERGQGREQSFQVYPTDQSIGLCSFEEKTGNAKEDGQHPH
jgi:hypothetical protein